MKKLNQKRMKKQPIEEESIATCDNCLAVIEFITDDNREYCDRCLEILKDPCYHCDKQESIDKAIAIVDTCETNEHILAAENYIDNFKKMFENVTAYDELIEYLNDKRTSIKL